MEQAKGLWVDELHAILWAYHTMPYSLAQEISYRLVYGANAVIPIELSESSPRMVFMAEEFYELAWRAELDLAEEDKKRPK